MRGIGLPEDNLRGLRDPSSDLAPQGHLLPQGEKETKEGDVCIPKPLRGK
jgi:hypothetical protein